ncbi:MAG: 3-oxoacyl-ACP reductase FabG [Chloroflexota bacterium]
MRILDKVAIVTGSARGIGAAISLRLAEEGANVAVCDVSDDVDAVAEKISATGRKALAMRTDVSDRGQVQSMVDEVVKQWGQIDILVNNAGINRDASIKNMTEAQWDAVIAVNLKGAFNCIQAVLPYMSQRKYGKIISLSSRAAMGNFGQANYSASKAGIMGLTRTAALELARFNVNVNAIAPGYIDTEMTRGVPDDVRERVIKAIPLQRVGDPRDVANLVLFLASDEASYITGQTIYICGGRSIGAASL